MTRFLLAISLLSLAGCGGGRPDPGPLPIEEAPIHRFRLPGQQGLSFNTPGYGMDCLPVTGAGAPALWSCKKGDVVTLARDSYVGAVTPAKFIDPLHPAGQFILPDGFPPLRSARWEGARPFLQF